MADYIIRKPDDNCDILYVDGLKYEYFFLNEADPHSYLLMAGNDSTVKDILEDVYECLYDITQVNDNVKDGDTFTLLPCTFGGHELPKQRYVFNAPHLEESNLTQGVNNGKPEDDIGTENGADPQEKSD